MNPALYIFGNEVVHTVEDKISPVVLMATPEGGLYLKVLPTQPKLVDFLPTLPSAKVQQRAVFIPKLP